MGVVDNGKGEIMRVHLFENKEPESIKLPAFLKQFEGKKEADPFKVGTDITAMGTSLKSAQAVASMALLAVALMVVNAYILGQPMSMRHHH